MVWDSLGLVLAVPKHQSGKPGYLFSVGTFNSCLVSIFFHCLMQKIAPLQWVHELRINATIKDKKERKDFFYSDKKTLLNKSTVKLHWTPCSQQWTAVNVSRYHSPLNPLLVSCSVYSVGLSRYWTGDQIPVTFQHDQAASLTAVLLSAFHRKQGCKCHNFCKLT